MTDSNQAALAVSVPVLAATELTRHYVVKESAFSKPKVLKAVDGVSFTLLPGRTLAVVGESGCGKSTLARMLTLIEGPTSGTFRLGGLDADITDKARLKALRNSVQMIFQDPYGSLNPRKKVGAILEEPLVINTTLSPAQRHDAAQSMMARVGLRPEFYNRYPHMFSGG